MVLILYLCIRFVYTWYSFRWCTQATSNSRIKRYDRSPLFCCNFSLVPTVMKPLLTNDFCQVECLVFTFILQKMNICYLSFPDSNSGEYSLTTLIFCHIIFPIASFRIDAIPFISNYRRLHGGYQISFSNQTVSIETASKYMLHELQQRLPCRSAGRFDIMKSVCSNYR